MSHSVSKPDSSVDESFEDLLSKYKLIQQELECIRKEETMALEPMVSPAQEEAVERTASEGRPSADPSPTGPEETSEMEKAEKKVFQAFNIKPLRQKLPTPADLDKLQRKRTEEDREGESRQRDKSLEVSVSETCHFLSVAAEEEAGGGDAEERTCLCCGEKLLSD